MCIRGTTTVSDVGRLLLISLIVTSATSFDICADFSATPLPVTNGLQSTSEWSYFNKNQGRKQTINFTFLQSSHSLTSPRWLGRDVVKQ